MTLSSFKNRSKYSILISFLVLYGVTAFIAGTTFKMGYLTKIKDLWLIKREQTKNKSNFALPVASPLPYADQQSGSIIGSYVKLCSNATYSFEVSYPKDWFTTYNSDIDKCTYFAPYSFTVFIEPSLNVVPIKLGIIEPQDWQSTVKFYENPNDFQNVISSQSIEINGRSVQKIKAQTTGQESLNRGLVKISYLVFNSRLPLVFTYQQLSEKDNTGDFEKILEEMVRSLNYF